MLDEAQLAFYRENGYLLVKSLLSRAEAERYRQEVSDLITRLNRPDGGSAWEGARELMGDGHRPELRHCHDVQFYSAAFSGLLVDERITGVAADLMGTPNVQLHHCKAFVKPPERGTPFPLHQDYPFFPHERDSVGAVILHLDDAPEEKGCVRIVPGSHRRGPLEHERSGGDFHLPFADWPLESSVVCEAEPGDALFFGYLTVHGSGVNVSSADRTTLLVQYRDPEDRPTVDSHTGSLGQGMMLRGIDPGVAALSRAAF